MLILIALFVISVVVFLVLLFLRDKEDPYDKARALFEENNLEELSELLDDLLRKEPDHPAYLSLRGEYFEAQGNEPGAIDAYEKALRSPVYSHRFNPTETTQKVADFYFNTGRIEEAFENYLNVLRLNPNVEGIEPRLGLIALGNGDISIALSYLEKTAQATEDSGLRLAYAVALYESGREEEAFAIIEEQLAVNPNDTNLNIIFIAMCQNSHYEEGSKKIKNTLPAVNDDFTRRLLYRLFLYFGKQLNKWDEMLLFLESESSKNMTEPETQRELNYFLLLLRLYLGKFEDALRVYNIFEKESPEYREIHNIKVFIDEIDIHPMMKPKKSFEEIFENVFSDLVPPRLVFSVSGFKKDFHIQMEKYFQESGDGYSLKDEYAPPSVDSATRRFLSIASEDFPRFGGRAIEYLGYTLKDTLPSKEKGAFDFIAAKKDASNLKALFSFRQYRVEPNLSDIFISNFIHSLQETKSDFGYIVTNASLTQAAEQAIVEQGNVNVISGEKLMEIIVDYENYLKGSKSKRG